MTLPAIPAGPTRVLTRVLFVDGGGAPSAQTGSLAHPFLTIQAAIDAVPIPTTVAESVEDWTILIAPGDYDESLHINGPIRIALIGLSALRLGRYTVAGEKQSNIVAVAGSTPRNVVWTYDNDQLIPDGAAPQLVIRTIAGSDVYRHGKPIANRISGSIIIQGSDWITQQDDTDVVKGPNGGTAFLAIANTQVDAGIMQDPAVTRRETNPTQPAIDTIGSLQPYGAFTGIVVDRHFHCRFRGAIRGPLNPSRGSPPAYVLAASLLSQYEQPVDVSQYSSISQGAFASGMSVGQAPMLGLLSVFPPGIVNSTFAGTFTGPAGSLLLDSTTNTWFIRNGGTVASAGTKAYLGGASQTLLVAAGRTLRVDDCGVTLLANASAGSFSVRLPPAVDDLTFTIKNIGSANSISVVPAIGEPIDGASSVTLVSPGTQAGASGIKIVAQGARWWIVGHV